MYHSGCDIRHSFLTPHGMSCWVRGPLYLTEAMQREGDNSSGLKDTNTWKRHDKETE